MAELQSSSSRKVTSNHLILFAACSLVPDTNNLRLAQYILFQSLSFVRFGNTLMKISEKDSFALRLRLLEHLFSSLRIKTVRFAFVWITEDSMILLSRIDILCH